eukprot:4677998-Pleurochrysis_carterae.AAC.1
MGWKHAPHARTCRTHCLCGRAQPRTVRRTDAQAANKCAFTPKRPRRIRPCRTNAQAYAQR